ncbi:hypothetical protein I5907_07555 [Panacibacter sp. DH6]|uniref:Uncharacterized protein n=1 Tax=Panacibacter microcysteis TaxID=2793269 RepID=A0A931E6J8_9BACT|nr:hypothetical protein [Panacibacter microcysteis]MBG9376084.1 hypothetical protein [Panacibacter microcysteis]
MQKFNLKDLIIAYALGMLPFALLLAILSLAGVTPVVFNGTPQYGIKGFLIALLLSPIFGFIMGLVSFITLSIGRFIYNKLFYRKAINKP